MPSWARLGACGVAGTMVSALAFLLAGYLVEGGADALPAILDFIWTVHFVQLLGIALGVTVLGLLLGGLYAAWKEQPLWFAVPAACGLLASLGAVFLTGYLGIRYVHWYEGLRDVVCFTLPFALGGSAAAGIWRRL